MSTQNKKGFTLIELMVVIVIIGILAAIAIPKLFGMSAKAKAQEVGPAVGTWAKMQQAYNMEKGNYSTYDSIGYKVPGAPATADGTGETGNFSYDVTKSEGLDFEAKSKFNSDPCGPQSEWTATFKNVLTDDPNVGIENKGSANGQDDAGCLTLTPNYCNIGAKAGGTGACASAN